MPAYDHPVKNPRITTMLCLLCSLAITLASSASPNSTADNNPNARVHKQGQLAIPGLSAPVHIHRDALSNPTINAQTFDDAIRAQGFIHAQERYFQMDATRRLAAGELAEFAPSLLSMDRENRPLRLRHVAQQVLQLMEPQQQHWLSIYTEGVNAGLANLPATPLEYALLNASPQPWKPEDSILVYLAMYQFLNMEPSIEKRAGVMRETLPEELFDFLTPFASRFDQPLASASNGNVTNDWQPMPIPSQDVIDLRQHANASLDHSHDFTNLVEDTPVALGSNNWAVAGSHTTDGRAILANDPHLQLSVPGVWYRAELRWINASHHQQYVIGLSLPGTPSIVIGSNGHLAWGFTNAMGDYQDLIIIHVNPENPNQYRTPEGWENFQFITERINIRGQGFEPLELKKTRWGIVTDHDHQGRPLVRKWTALEPELVDLNIIHLAFAQTLEQGVEIGANWGGPPQNILFADSTGRIAWVISGHMPLRFGYDGRYPVSWADGDKGWAGMLPTEDKPRIIDPPNGILFTANNRTMPLEQAQRFGGIWTIGERAHRIAQMLHTDNQFTEHDLFQMQLDTRLKLFDFYRDLALAAIRQAETPHEFDEPAKQILQSWNGTADADQPAVQLLQLFRRNLHQAVIGPLVTNARNVQSDFSYHWFMAEEPVRRLLEEQPLHLLHPRYLSWNHLLAERWHHTLDHFVRSGNDLNTPWGQINAAHIAHPLTLGAPALAKHLNLESHPQPGHTFAVRVASAQFGASARLVVSPGREDQGILHIPAGQSGHPQSPHYRDSHAAWAAGEPLPLRAGNPSATLELIPAK